MKQAHLKLVLSLFLLTTSVTGLSTGGQLDQNSAEPRFVLGQSSMSAWGGFSPPGAFIPQLTSMLQLSLASSGQPPVAGPSPAFDAGFGSSFYGLNGFNPFGAPSYSYGRKRRSTAERKKRFLPGGFGAPLPGFSPLGELPGPFMLPPLLPPIVPPMIPHITPLPPLTLPPPIPFPMISEFSLASPLIPAVSPPIPLPSSSVLGGPFGSPFGGPLVSPLGGPRGGPLGSPFGGSFGGFISEPFFPKPFDTDFGLGGGFRFSNEYDDLPADVYVEPFPFPGGFDTYGKLVDKWKKSNGSDNSKNNQGNGAVSRRRYGNPYSNSYGNEDYGYSKKSYGNFYSNDNNKAYGSRKKNNYRKNGSYKSKPKYNKNDYSSNDDSYNSRQKREFGLNVGQRQYRSRLVFNQPVSLA